MRSLGLIDAEVEAVEGRLRFLKQERAELLASMQAKRLANMRRDYETIPYTLPELADRYGLTVGRVANIARENKWTRHPDRRGKPGRIPRQHALAVHQVA